MNAQGLPINFIVLAALAILILILAAGFVIGGGTSAGAALSPAQTANTCRTHCVGLQNWASTQTHIVPSGWLSTVNSYTVDAPSAYCNDYTVSGLGSMKCDNPKLGITCLISTQDGTNCVVMCAFNGPQPFPKCAP